MQFKSLLCVKVSGQELSQRKTQMRDLIFSKLFLKPPKMLPVQLQVNTHAGEHGGHSGKAAQASASNQKSFIPPVVTLVKILHEGWGGLMSLLSFSSDTTHENNSKLKMSPDQTHPNSNPQGDICSS